MQRDYMASNYFKVEITLNPDKWICRKWLCYISKHYPVSAEDLTDPIFDNLAGILVKSRLRALHTYLLC
jgi:hypothetical protein